MAESITRENNLLISPDKAVEYANGIIPPADIAIDSELHRENMLTKEMVSYIRDSNPDFGIFLGVFDTSEWNQLRGVDIDKISDFIPDYIREDAVKADVYVSYGPQEQVSAQKADGSTLNVPMASIKLVCLDVTKSDETHARAYILADDFGHVRENLDKFEGTYGSSCFGATVLPDEKINFLDRSVHDNPHSYDIFHEVTDTTAPEGSYIKPSADDCSSITASLAEKAEIVFESGVDAIIEAYLRGADDILASNSKYHDLLLDYEDKLVDASLLFHHAVGELVEKGNDVGESYDRLISVSAEGNADEINSQRADYGNKIADYISSAEKISISDETLKYSDVKDLYSALLDKYSVICDISDYYDRYKAALEKNTVELARLETPQEKLDLICSTDIKPVSLLYANNIVREADFPEDLREKLTDFKRELVEGYNQSTDSNGNKMHIDDVGRIYSDYGFKYIPSEISAVSPVDIFKASELNIDKVTLSSTPLIETINEGVYEKSTIKQYYESYRDSSTEKTPLEASSDFEKHISGTASKADIDAYLKGKFDTYAKGEVIDFKDNIEKNGKTDNTDRPAFNRENFESLARNAQSRVFSRVDRDKTVAISPTKMQELEAKYGANFDRAVESTKEKLEQLREKIIKSEERLDKYGKTDPRIRGQLDGFQFEKFRHDNLVHDYVKEGGAVGIGTFVERDSTLAERFSNFSSYWLNNPYVSLFYSTLIKLDKDETDNPDVEKRADTDEANRLSTNDTSQSEYNNDTENVIFNASDIASKNDTTFQDMENTIEDIEKIENDVTGTDKDITDDEFKDTDYTDNDNPDGIDDGIGNISDNNVSDEADEDKNDMEKTPADGTTLSESQTDLDKTDTSEIDINNHDDVEDAIRDLYDDSSYENTDSYANYYEDLDTAYYDNGKMFTDDLYSDDMDLNSLPGNSENEILTLSDESTYAELSDIEERNADEPVYTSVNSEGDEAGYGKPNDAIDDIEELNSDIITVDDDSIKEKSEPAFDTGEVTDTTMFEYTADNNSDADNDKSTAALAATEDDLTEIAHKETSDTKDETENEGEKREDTAERKERSSADDGGLETDNISLSERDNEYNEDEATPDFGFDNAVSCMSDIMLTGTEFTADMMDYAYDAYVNLSIEEGSISENFINAFCEAYMDALDKISDYDAEGFADGVISEENLSQNAGELFSAFVSLSEEDIDKVSEFSLSAMDRLTKAGVAEDIAGSIVLDINTEPFKDMEYISMGGEQITINEPYNPTFEVNEDLFNDVINETAEGFANDMEIAESITDIGMDAGMTPEASYDMGLAVVGETSDWLPEDTDLSELFYDYMETVPSDSTSEVINDSSSDMVFELLAENNAPPDTNTMDYLPDSTSDYNNNYSAPEDITIADSYTDFESTSFDINFESMDTDFDYVEV